LALIYIEFQFLIVGSTDTAASPHKELAGSLTARLRSLLEKGSLTARSITSPEACLSAVASLVQD